MRAAPMLLLALLLATDAAPMFERVQPELFAAGAALTNAWADFDKDGDPDLFVGFNGRPNRLYRNERGRFTDVAATAGVADARPTRAAAWVDLDGDGDADLVVGFTAAGGPVLRAYRNDDGAFSDATSEWMLRVDSGAVRQVSGIDVDGDADIDLFVAFRDRPNALFRNEGGRFHDVAGALGLADTRHSVGAVWFDYESDGDLDLYVGNMDGDANGLFRNDGGRFTDVAVEAGVAWGGRAPAEATNGTVRPCVEDVDNDGRLDLFMANYGPNGLFLGRGETFEDASRSWGVAIDSRYDSCAFADYDNDGRLDLFVNGTVTGGVSYPDHLMRNTGVRFDSVTPPELAALDADHGVQWSDFDDDGDLDLALTAAAATGHHALMRNLLDATAAGRSLSVLVRDSAGRPNLAGAEVRLYAAGTRRIIGTRVVDTGSGYDSQNILPVHFGVPDGGRVDIEIAFPAGGRRVTGRLNGLDPRSLGGRPVELRLTRSGRIVRRD